MHFKELFSLDGKPTNLDADDIARRNRIAVLLEEWGLLKLVTPLEASTVAPLSHIKILKHGEKKDWTLVTKYNVGAKRIS